MTEMTEQAAREDLAAIYRLAAREGLDDGIWNHFTLAIPGRDDRFLLKPHGLLFSEVSASNLIVVDLDGAMVAGEGLWEPTAFYIHARLHKAFPAMRCVVHAHMPFASGLANAGARLLPISQDSLRHYGQVAYYDDFNGLALDEAEGDRMVAAMGGCEILIMRHHGVLVGAATAAEAFYILHYLEVACRMQATAMQFTGGATPESVPQAVAQLTHSQMNRNRPIDAAMHLAAYKRVLDRENPGYRD